MGSLFEFVSNYSLNELRAERDKWREITDKEKRLIDVQTEKYNKALATYQLIESAVKLREQDVTPNGQQPQKMAIAGSGKTELMLNMIRSAHGLRPGEVYRGLIERGVNVRRPYVSTVLMRLKERDKVYVEDGRYFAKDGSLKD